MQHTQTNDPLHSLIEQLREYISENQRPLRSEAKKATAESHGERIYRSLKEVLITKQAEYSASLSAVLEQLRAYVEALRAQPDADTLRARSSSLARSYEDFLLALREANVEDAEKLNRSRQLKPINYVRNLFHASMGLLAASLYHFVLTRSQALFILVSVFVAFGALEVTRRFSARWNDFLVDRFFGKISRPSERHRVNSSTLYVLALIIITALYDKLPVEAAILLLGLGDPMASIFGKKFGRKKLFRDKSYAGTIAFFSTGLIVSSALFLSAGIWVGYALFAAFMVSLAGAVTELLSSRMDDNFSIPVVCASIGALLL
jgi:dolichol kinase